jgi:hypothetical protein
MFSLSYGGHWKLKHVAPGTLFLLPSGNIGLMTEYGQKSYLLESGETCCADMETPVIVLTVNEEDVDSYKSEAS